MLFLRTLARSDASVAATSASVVVSPLPPWTCGRACMRVRARVRVRACVRVRARVRIHACVHASVLDRRGAVRQRRRCGGGLVLRRTLRNMAYTAMAYTGMAYMRAREYLRVAVNDGPVSCTGCVTVTWLLVTSSHLYTGSVSASSCRVCVAATWPKKNWL